MRQLDGIVLTAVLLGQAMQLMSIEASSTRCAPQRQHSIHASMTARCFSQLANASLCTVLQVLFHSPFLERCKQIIAAALAEACSSIQEPLAAALEAAAQHDPEPAGHLQPSVWPSVQGTAAEKAAAAAAADALERAGSLWTAGSLGQANGTWGLSSRAPSMRPSGALKEEQGPTGMCCAVSDKATDLL